MHTIETEKVNLEVIKYLIDSGANISERINPNFLALNVASENGNIELVKYFVEEKGYDVNIKDKNNYTPLIKASNNGYIDIVKYLVGNGANINARAYGNTALISTLRIMSFLGAFEDILEKHDIDQNKLLSEIVPSFNTGTEKEYLAVIKYLVENNVNINAKDNDGYTALMQASLMDSLQLIKYLVENGSDVNIKNNEGDTAMDIAEKSSYKSIVEYLSSVL